VTVVCLPSEEAVHEVGPLPEAVRTVIWDGSRRTPPGVEFLVPEYPGGAKPDLSGMPELKVVQLLSAGVEGWPELVPDGVTLCNGRGVHGGSTAELAVLGLLAVLRRLPHYLRQQEQGVWEPGVGEGLDGKRVLLLGAGDIGEHLRAAVEVFGAEVTTVARRARSGVRTMDELPSLLPSADVVVLALPSTPSTNGLVDAAFLAALPDGAVLVNIARGRLVDTDALVAELQSRRLRAFLDVFDQEPLPEGHPLWTAPNVILTPHVGGGTQGWQRRGYRLVREQVRRFVAGEQLVNVVSEGY
jgi:phosphoglycerate dehydrogenase-like enzyme